ncbi:MAG TPA: hypothetical protein VEK79_12090 [Thermoanaerobaculia bacterium]|nr:hypothetical protein [Thermoanaerobaculia bacterium]
MRKLIIILLALLAAIGAAAAYLILTTPKTAQPLRFPLTESHRQLLARVPASADTFALIPSAALLHHKLLANPVTRDPVLQWTHEHELPRPWMLGGADLAVWKSGKVTSYAVRLDSFRALFVRAWLLMSSNADARWDGSTLIMHEPAPSAPATVDDVLRLAAALPEGDLLVVQREGGRGAFPPIARPAVTSVRVAPSEITLVSRAASDDITQQREIRPRFPRNAMLSAAFAAPPRILGDFNRLIGADIDALVDDGGSMALYDVDGGTFLPRPKGVIAVPADDRARQQMKTVEAVAALVGETRDTGDQILVSFDRSSMGLYIEDEMVPATWPATQWAMRVDPQRLVPVLRRAGDSTGLRIAAPRIHRAARDLRRWIDVLQHADAVEAAASVAGGVEELRVRVSSK